MKQKFAHWFRDYRCYMPRTKVGEQFVSCYIQITHCYLPSFMTVLTLILVRLDQWYAKVSQNIYIVTCDVMDAHAQSRLLKVIDGVIASVYSLKYDLALVLVVVSISYLFILCKHKRLMRELEMTESRSKYIKRGIVVFFCIHVVACIAICTILSLTEEGICHALTLLRNRLGQTDVASSLGVQAMESAVNYVITRKTSIGHIEMSLALVMMFSFIMPYWVYGAAILSNDKSNRLPNR